MQISSFFARVSLLLAFGPVCCANLASAQSAARVMAVTGSAKAVEPKGNERLLQKGAELFAGDKVVTQDDSLVQLRLNDGGYMSVRSNTEMVIDRFVYDEKDSSKSNFLVSLLRGGFRSITGLIGRTNPNGYQIRSSTATIGIRGTDHEPVVILDIPGAQNLGAPGLYDKVNDGETFIRSNGGVLSLKRGDVGFAPFATDAPPQVLLKIPDFYKVDLKTDARDGKDNGDDNKADGSKRGANGLLRPSVAARREALSGSTTATPGAPATSAQTNGDTPTNTQPAPTTNGTRITAPAAGTNTGSAIPSGTTGTSGVTGNNNGTAVAPVLTPEQKRAILQTLTTPPTLQNAPRTAPTAAPK